MIQQYVTTRVDEGTRRLEVFVPTPDGGRMAVATIEYKRRASNASNADDD